MIIKMMRSEWLDLACHLVKIISYLEGFEDGRGIELHDLKLDFLKDKYDMIFRELYNTENKEER